MATTPLPVTVIGGYLGAGKTTLVNRLLRQANGARLAVLVNEFGELPIDADLIESSDDNVINIAGGCVCCSYGSDLMAALMEMESRHPAPDHLLIEASGVALPKAIAQSVQLMTHYTIDGIVVMADAETVQRYASDPYLADTIERQFNDADIVILNKIDLVSASQRAATNHWLAGKAPQGVIVETANADVANPVILGIATEFLDDESGEAHNHDHSDAHASMVFSLDSAVAPERLAEQLVNPELSIIRAKGFVFSPDGGLHALQIVGRRWQVTDAPPNVKGPSRIVCIGRQGQIDVNTITDVIASTTYP